MYCLGVFIVVLQEYYNVYHVIEKHGCFILIGGVSELHAPACPYRNV